MAELDPLHAIDQPAVAAVAGAAAAGAAAAPARGIDVSVVVPVLNEEGSVGELARRVAEVLGETPSAWELIFVDDGSTDATPQVLADLAAGQPAVRVLTLQRNFGKAAALTAGFDAARGRFVITMDADLQDDPA